MHREGRLQPHTESELVGFVELSCYTINLFKTQQSYDRLHKHRNIGKAEVQGVLEFWNQALDLNEPDENGKRPNLTTDQGRKTFCTIAERFLGFSADEVMAVSHHDDPEAYFFGLECNNCYPQVSVSIKVCPKVYKSVYVVNSSFCDPEKECAITRRFNLYGSGHHIPSVALSVPCAIESIKEETSEEFEQVHRSVFPWHARARYSTLLQSKILGRPKHWHGPTRRPSSTGSST